MFRSSASFVVFCLIPACAGATAAAPLSDRLPDSSLNLKITAPIKTWDEAIPLGNGSMGVLLWGERNTLRLSLDRGDLWDERPSPAHLAVKDRFNWTRYNRRHQRGSQEPADRRPKSGGSRPQRRLRKPAAEGFGMPVSFRECGCKDHAGYPTLPPCPKWTSNHSPPR